MAAPTRSSSNRGRRQTVSKGRRARDRKEIAVLNRSDVHGLQSAPKAAKKSAPVKQISRAATDDLTQTLQKTL